MGKRHSSLIERYFPEIVTLFSLGFFVIAWNASDTLTRAWLVVSGVAIIAVAAWARWDVGY